ncbi:MAG: hypothetical protein HC902_06630 [Calothrix sp. SM1_5_4]|nr:hypothetical protein [Calothrix sp. SM1_5_4]
MGLTQIELLPKIGLNAGEIPDAQAAVFSPDTKERVKALHEFLRSRRFRRPHPGLLFG